MSCHLLREVQERHHRGIYPTMTGNPFVAGLAIEPVFPVCLQDTG